MFKMYFTYCACVHIHMYTCVCVCGISGKSNIFAYNLLNFNSNAKQ